jgi:hypothetical protein
MTWRKVPNSNGATVSRLASALDGKLTVGACYEQY